jgi:hypothetical protein
MFTLLKTSTQLGLITWNDEIMVYWGYIGDMMGHDGI